MRTSVESILLRAHEERISTARPRELLARPEPKEPPEPRLARQPRPAPLPSEWQRQQAEDVRRCWALYGNGASVPAIAEALGINERRVYRLLRKAQEGRS